MMMYRQNSALACKESRQSPWSLQPCWEGDGGDPAIGETTTIPVKRVWYSDYYLGPNDFEVNG